MTKIGFFLVLFCLFGSSLVFGRENLRDSKRELYDLAKRVGEVYPHLKGREVFEFAKIVLENKNYTHEDVRATQDPVPRFTCNPFGPSSQKPTSADRLRISDIDIVAAVGDSITAGFGADAKSIFGVFTEYRGVSWSIGGDERLDPFGEHQYYSLPVLLKKYNPKVKGFALGTGGADSKNANLNRAVSGAIAKDIPGQVDKLISMLKAYGDDSWNNEWKLVTLWIGGNDLCAVCKGNAANTPENYQAYIEQGLRKLKTVPRVFVNLVNIIDVTRLYELTSGFCSLLHGFECSCGTNSKKSVRDEVTQKFIEYNRRIDETAKKAEFNDKEDFRVVAQPLFTDTDIPRVNGKPDKSYFAPDCFHFSTLGHEASAIALWNNMIEKVGEKRTKWEPNEEIECPKETDYIWTVQNSN